MLKIIRFNPVEISDVLFHVLDYLDLLGMEVELSLYGRDFYLFPFLSLIHISRVEIVA